MVLSEQLPDSWQHPTLLNLLNSDEFKAFDEKLQALEKEGKLRPIYQDIFKALEQTPFDKVKVVILGQDPYPTKFNATGLAFSVDKETVVPRSLENIFKEIHDDLGYDTRNWKGDLTPWAEQGVLLLNATFTTQLGESNKHQDSPWRDFTIEILRLLTENVSKKKPLVFMLWGNHAMSYKPLLHHADIQIIQSSHPSPFSAHKTFFGSQPFSRANHWLQGHYVKPINWNLSTKSED